MTLIGTRARQTRPGLVIKAVLSGAIGLEDTPSPLADRDPRIVASASVAELHRTYKALWQREQIDNDRTPVRRGMSYHSFAAMVRQARKLGLLQLEHREETDEPLMTIRDGEVVPSTRNFYELTDRGRDEEDAWLSLRGAFGEKFARDRDQI